VGALGGVGEFNHAMALALQSQGYRVSLVAPEFFPRRTDKERAAGVQHVQVQLPERQLGGRLVMDVASAQQLMAELSPDIVLFADGCETSNLRAKQAAANLSVPMIFSYGLVLGLRMGPENQSLFEETVRKAAAVVAVSRQNAQFFLRTYVQSGILPTVIPYGRPDTFFAPVNVAGREARRSELGLTSEDVLFLTAARYDPIKGYNLFVEAIDRLRREPVWGKLHFAWAGGGVLEAQLRAALERLGVGDHVHLLGPRDDIAEWLEAADAFVLPSYAEGMPLSIMEAMAKGLPVIATSVGGIPEQLADSGIVIEDPNQLPRAMIRQLARAIDALGRDSAERKRLGRRAKIRAEALYGQERMIVDYARLIGGALPRSDGVVVPHDYVSPGLETVRPDGAFPNKILGNTGECDWPYLRREVMHLWYVDRRFRSVGFVSRDEAHILYNCARTIGGGLALEIGCFLGWSTCHLALAGVALDVVDPLLANPVFRDSVEASLTAAGVRDRVNLVAGRSPESIHDLAKDGRRWALIFIDGDHEGDAPRLDAATVEPYAAEDCIILFHDLAAPAVANGVRHFRERGWKIRIYRTMQIMAAAWKGRKTPPVHIPDPSIEWSLPPHLADLATEGI
jgi:glycosyltransferase involved in cell wall biosynthesis/predicted O-methyltransferase YrrM